MSEKKYDLICMGRSSIDLYSNDSGAEFKDITSFSSFVGGCPTNIAVGTRRLGLKSLLLTAVGEDPVGDFILDFLRKEAVESRFVPRKNGFRSSAVLLGIEPPDKFPLVFYRENCADFQLNIDDVDAVPIEESRAILVSGTGLSREPSRSATIYAAEKARAAKVTVFLDLDFRADQWTNGPSADIRAYGVTVRSILNHVDFAIGTEEEIKASMLKDKSLVKVKDSKISAPEVSGDIVACIDALLKTGLKAVIEKRGARGAIVHLPGGKSETAEPFKVEICNVLGAGDAFASGFIYGYLKGWDWAKCVRMGNAVGAIVVTRQGCANFMPSETEALDFVTLHGGFTKESAGVPR